MIYRWTPFTLNGLERRLTHSLLTQQCSGGILSRPKLLCFWSSWSESLRKSPSPIPLGVPLILPKTRYCRHYVKHSTHKYYKNLKQKHRRHSLLIVRSNIQLGIQPLNNTNWQQITVTGSILLYFQETVNYRKLCCRREATRCFMSRPQNLITEHLL